MEMQELEITIDREGRVLVAVRGVQGEDCLSLTQNIENAVGSVEERTYSSDYYGQTVSVDGHRSVTR